MACASSRPHRSAAERERQPAARISPGGVAEGPARPGKGSVEEITCRPASVYRARRWLGWSSLSGREPGPESRTTAGPVGAGGLRQPPDPRSGRYRPARAGLAVVHRRSRRTTPPTPPRGPGRPTVALQLAPRGRRLLPRPRPATPLRAGTGARGRGRRARSRGPALAAAEAHPCTVARLRSGRRGQRLPRRRPRRRLPPPAPVSVAAPKCGCGGRAAIRRRSRRVDRRRYAPPRRAGSRPVPPFPRPSPARMEARVCANSSSACEESRRTAVT